MRPRARRRAPRGGRPLRQGQLLAADPVIRVPSLVLHGGADPCNDPATSDGKEHLFAGSYRRVVLDGLGHFPQRQVPARVFDALMPFLGRFGSPA